MTHSNTFSNKTISLNWLHVGPRTGGYTQIACVPLLSSLNTQIQYRHKNLCQISSKAVITLVPSIVVLVIEELK